MTAATHSCETAVVRRWVDAGTWTGGGLRREVFFFGSGGDELYGSLYASAPPRRRWGIVVCSSWGVEADRCDRIVHGLALGAANLGGAGLVFHYPGYGDSHGDLGSVTMETLAMAAVDAVAAGSDRFPHAEWILTGLMLGASVACLGAARAHVRRLLLVQPSLRPGAYFARLSRSPSRTTLGIGAARQAVAFGYPLPDRVLDAGEEADAAVREALETFEGRGTVVRYAGTPAERGVERFQLMEAPGSWRFGAKDYPELAQVAGEALDRQTRSGP